MPFDKRTTAPSAYRALTYKKNTVCEMLKYNLYVRLIESQQILLKKRKLTRKLTLAAILVLNGRARIPRIRSDMVFGLDSPWLIVGRKTETNLDENKHTQLSNPAYHRATLFLGYYNAVVQKFTDDENFGQKKSQKKRACRVRVYIYMLFA